MRVKEFQHLVESYPPEQGGFRVIDLAETVIPVVDAIGSKWACNPSLYAWQGAPGVNQVYTGYVPDGKIWWVAHGVVTHNQVGVQHNICMEIEFATGAGAYLVCVTDNFLTNILDNRRVITPRPFIVPAGGRVEARCIDGLGGAANLTAIIVYYELNPGQYVIPF